MDDRTVYRGDNKKKNKKESTIKYTELCRAMIPNVLKTHRRTWSTITSQLTMLSLFVVRCFLPIFVRVLLFPELIFVVFLSGFSLNILAVFCFVYTLWLSSRYNLYYQLPRFFLLSMSLLISPLRCWALCMLIKFLVIWFKL